MPLFRLESLEARSVFDATPFADNHTIVRMDTTEGAILIELFDDLAPRSVASFLSYVSQGLYDNTLITRGEDAVFRRNLGGAFVLEDSHLRRITTLAGELDDSPAGVGRFTIAMVRDPDNPNSPTGEWVFNSTGGSRIREDPQYAVFGEMVVGYQVLSRWLVFGTRSYNYDSDGDGTFDAGKSVVLRQDSDLGDDDEASDIITVTSVGIIDNPSWSTRALEDQRVRGLIPARNQIRYEYFTTNSLGRPIGLLRPQNIPGWDAGDIGLQTEAQLTGAIVPIDTPRDGVVAAAVAPSAAGLLLFEFTNSFPRWTVRNLTAQIAGSLVIASELALYTDSQANFRVVGLTEAGPDGPQLVEYAHNGGTSWSFRNISATDLASQNQATPAFVGFFSAFRTGWDAVHVVGLNAGGELLTVWRAPDHEQWQVHNLSALIGAPAFRGDVTALLPAQRIDIVATTTTGATMVARWRYDVWSLATLAQVVGIPGPELRENSPVAYVTRWGGLNVAGIDADGDLVIYWWSPVESGWQVHSISDLIPGTDPLRGRLDATKLPGSDWDLQISATTQGGDILRFHWQISTNVWEVENLSETAVFDLINRH